MKYSKLLLILACMTLLLACNSNQTRNSRTGGFLRTNEFQKFKSLFPLEVDEINNYHIACQVYEGLTRFNADLQVVLGLAREWKLSSDKKTYTFTLRRDAFFHDDSCFKDGKGRRVTAGDIKYCFEQLCTNTPNNRQFAVTFKDRVEGANEFYEDAAKQIEGIAVENDSVISLRLNQPDPNFLAVLAMAGCFIYPHEAWEQYGTNMSVHPVGTGPFEFKSLSSASNLILTKNQHYWAKDESGIALPYLDSISWTFIADRNTELEKFKNNEIDMMYRVPSQTIKALFEAHAGDTSKIDFEVFTAPAMSLHFYGCNLNSNQVLNDKTLRKAINLAIDREKIIDDVFQGEGSSAAKYIVPYNVAFDNAGFPYRELKGIAYNPDSARALLAAAGYGKKTPLPALTLDINDGNAGKNIQTAMKVQNMLKENLGINLNLNIVNWSDQIDLVQKGKSKFFRYAWVCDYADPESFLAMFYSKSIPKDSSERSYVNLTRFKSRLFDSYFEQSKTAVDEKIRMELLGRATQIVFDEMPIVPLYHDENTRVMKKKVKNMSENAMNYIDFREVWLSE